ncbi:xanthine dehydrogenase molybdopterin binding subunit [Deinococcus cellulosilyticus]|uniref:Dehydrogenase n=1 Tax=Deinococcus cellulosilyticus (strain DSM 18568 / NBRC 106333 / KACC 11606 / 5516J-15) TaxID=1223518 RepID=A0A511NBA3_DEIC1|nr:xanthine dehydrogenase molybdopterin binding subunit [Deinococcus cellulosilyticus]GEM50082.1 dehydrogenase [Deinococcus cellulosilyticus NBRC 106333 = KACC 11606]
MSKHESAWLHVDGRARFTEDLLRDHPHALHAYPVQSPHAHARVLGIDTALAEVSEGVVRVLTAKDVPGVNDTGISRRDEPLFPELVEHAGQAVVWVLAKTREQARIGAQQVKVEYEPLKPILGLKEAIEQGSFHSAPIRMSRGQTEQALENAEHLKEGELQIGGQEHFYLETQATLAKLDESGTLFVHSSTQHPSETQDIVARVLGVPRSEVIVQCTRMGGGFGGKESQANPYASVAALGAKLTGKPVLVRLSRAQDTTLSGKRHPFYARYQVGFTSEGMLQALKLDLYADGGFSLDLSEPIVSRALFHSDNAYFIPHMQVTGRVCKTHKTSQTAFRGFGGPQGMVVIEHIVDLVARTLNLPPHEVRQKNFYSPEEFTHYGQQVTDAWKMNRVWEEALLRSHYLKRTEEIRSFNAVNRTKVRGLAITPVKFGISFTMTAYNQAGALVLIYQDGSVQVNHGGTEMGQGLHTKIQAIASRTLGIAPEKIKVMPTRTDKVPNTSATAASTGSDLNGGAVRNACERLKSRLLEVAAKHHQLEKEHLDLKEGFFWHQGEKIWTFEEAVKAAYYQRIQLFSDGFYATPHIHWDREKATGRPFAYFSYGACVAEIELDTVTGMHQVRQVDIVHDVGESLTPAIDRGQVEGGFIQGMGWLTLEDLRWNDAGLLATRNASTYKLPTLMDAPEVFNVHLLENTPQEGVVFGSKAVGEPPLMLAIAVREAIKDALHTLTGHFADVPSPITPEVSFFAAKIKKAHVLG